MTLNADTHENGQVTNSGESNLETLVRYHLADGVAVITLDDGKVNVLGLAMQDQLNAALDRAEADGAAVLLTGNAQVFSGGFDLKVFKAGGPDVVRMLIGGGELCERLLTFPRPVVIAASGHAMAMGALMLLCADYRIGIDSGARVQLNETAIGMTLPYFGVELARARLATPWLNRALVNAEALTPSQAVACGFLDEVVPVTALPETARARTAALAALHPEAFVATRSRVHEPLLAAAKKARLRDEEEWKRSLPFA